MLVHGGVARVKEFKEGLSETGVEKVARSCVDNNRGQVLSFSDAAVTAQRSSRFAARVDDLARVMSTSLRRHREHDDDQERPSPQSTVEGAT